VPAGGGPDSPNNFPILCKKVPLIEIVPKLTLFFLTSVTDSVLQTGQPCDELFALAFLSSCSRSTLPRGL